MAKISYMFVYFDGTEGGRHGLAWPRYPGGDFQVVSDHGQVGTVPNLQQFPGNHGISMWLLIKISLTLDTGIMAVSSARGLGLMRKEDAFKIYKILHPLIIFPCFILNENKRNMGEIEYKT